MSRRRKTDQPELPLIGGAGKPKKPPPEPKEFQIGWAIHQMKNEAQFRDVVVARQGHTIVEFDAAGQEFRWMAIASGDRTMLQLCAKGEDPHSFMGARIDPSIDYKDLMRRRHDDSDKEAKRIRKGGKFGNLSCQYRIGDKTLMSQARVMHGMNIDLKQAKHINFVYKKTYPGVPVYWEEQIAKVKQLGYVETFAGRRVTVKGDWSGANGWGMGSTAINYRIQGTGGDQKYLALSVLDQLCLELDARFILDLHDGLYHEVPDQHVTEFCARGKKLLDELPYRDAWGFEPPIPMPFDCKFGKSWGSLVEWKP